MSKKKQLRDAHEEMFSTKEFFIKYAKRFPNATEYTQFPSPVLQAGQRYDRKTRYAFKKVKK